MRWLAACFLILGLIILSPFQPIQSARAQGNITCSTIYNWPSSPWSIFVGTAEGQAVFNRNPSAPTVSGDAGKIVEVRLHVPDTGVDFIRPVSARVITETNSSQSTQIVITTYNGTYLSERRTGTTNQPFTWLSTNLQFQGKATTDVVIQFYLEDQSTTLFLGIQLVQLCIALDATLTPTPTLTLTPSRTATPTFTPSMTDTPVPLGTPTDTLTPTDTPTGTLSPTPPPTETPGPTDTEAPLGLTIEAQLFNTVEPPDDCKDKFNSCSALPFPLIPMTAISLSTPVPITAVAILNTATLIPPRGSSTPDASSTAADGGVADFATNTANVIDQFASTPTLNDINGTPTGMADAANQIGGYTGQFFGVFRAIQNFFLGKTGTIIAFLLLIILFIILVRILLFIIPILISFFRLILAIVQAVIP